MRFSVVQELSPKTSPPQEVKGEDLYNGRSQNSQLLQLPVSVTMSSMVDKRGLDWYQRLVSILEFVADTHNCTGENDLVFNMAYTELEI